MKNGFILTVGRNTAIHGSIDANDPEVFNFRKQILKRGRFMHPNGRRYVNFDDKFFNEVMRAFEGGAVDEVPVMIGTHDEEKTERIGGRVSRLAIEPDGLFAYGQVREPGTVAQLRNKDDDGKGLVDEVSVGISAVRKDTGEIYPITLRHVSIVTHGFYRGMDGFEEIAATLEGGVTQYLDISKEEIVMTIEEILAALKAKGIEFTTVEELTAAIDKMKEEESSTDPPEVGEEQILAVLKAKGIDVETFSDLKASLDKVESHDTVLNALSAIVNPDKPDADGEINVKDLAATVATMSNKFTAMETRNAELEASLVTKDAEVAVDKLVEAGKVIPAKKEHFVKLYKSDSELFASLTEDMPEIVPVGQAGRSGGSDDNLGGDLDVDAEVERILAASTMKNKE